MPIAHQVRQHPERAVPDGTPAILAAGLVAHVAFADGEQPYVLPMSYHFDPATPDRLWIHGGPASRLLRVLAGGARVAIGVTLVDGLVYSRAARHHSMNYRSAVVFGRARVVADRTLKQHVFEAMIGRYFPGRSPGRDYEAPPPHHLDATVMLEVALEATSSKARRGSAKGPRDADPTAPGTAGIAPVS